jgi:TonB-linked SusC/RagA family outer membrane protein
MRKNYKNSLKRLRWIINITAIGAVFFATTAAMAQNVSTVKGTVRNSDGEPLLGASIVVKGTSNGATTDETGSFSINFPQTDNAVLRVSYVGLQDKEVKVGNQSELNVILDEEIQLIDEVVVTGYQTISRERATGSFDKIDSKTIEARPASNLSSILQGLVAGMQGNEELDGSVTFQIRGTSSLYADKQPLIVVDGFPIQGNINTINPNDVESVTILKDAAAASIWGARSANGVIVITTKKGKKERLNVEARAFYRIGALADLDYVLDQADSRTHVDYELKALENNWILSGEYSPSFANLRYPLTLAQELYYQNKYLGLSTGEMNAGLEKLRNTSNREQLKDLLMRHQSLQQYNLIVSGGTDKSQNYFSLLYENNKEGTIKRGYERVMATYNNHFDITKWLKANFATTLQRQTIDSSGPAIGDFTTLSPYELLLNPDDSYAANIYGYNRYELSQLPLDKLPYEDWSYNLLREIRGREITSRNDLIRSQLGLTATIISGLTYDFKAQYETGNTKNETYYNEDTYYVRNMVNSMTEYNSTTQTVGISRIPKGGISVSPSFSEFYNYIIRNQLNFNKTLFKKHSIAALTGLEITEISTKSEIRPYVYGYDKERKISAVPAYGYGSASDRFTDFFGTTGTTINGGSSSFSLRTDRYVSYYANVGYTYDEKYGVSFSARGDGSNFISNDPKLRWAPMWSVGGQWHLSKEKFVRDLPWINRLSTRLTYGINGNVEKSTSPLTLIATSSTISTTTGTATSSISSYGNPKLRWETTETTNFGIDFAFFNNKLSGKIDLYNRLGKDIMGDVAIPSVNGIKSQRLNNARIINRGIELEISGNFKIPNIDFRWQTTLTYAHNKNKIEDLYVPSIYAYQLAQGTYVEGKPIGAVYSYTYAGSEDGIPYVYGVDGNKVSMNDLSLHNTTIGLPFMNYEGTNVPPHTIGWVNSFSYNGFNLYVYFYSHFGGVFKLPTNNSMPGVGNSKTSVGRFMNEVFESDGSLYPTFPNASEGGYYRWDRYIPNLSYFVQSSSFIRLKEITLEYNIPSVLSKKLNIQNTRVFVQARDLGIIYAANRKKYDPEWLPGNNKPVTNFTFGININF